MSDATKKRASRMRRFADADDEYKETGNTKAAVERQLAMRDGTAHDWEWARERLHTRTVDDYRRRKELMRRFGIDKLEPMKGKNDG